ncbi:hypothetical protein J4E90_009582 [Alternaria incomplexa]|nr:uncharacterized protein J4E93_004248 [Alternaria ventricosa]XP_049222869.1 uncharacterized protein J4E78_004439 [Alternaria triticimaculans]XP_051287178.1 uncharacterized protein J4E90_009582 [Alternaria incomplexa]KAI4701662.1 hypothetical protein J4E81_003402 [Alternaria sp. BMP 2799]KAI4708787.1 hypothetical protein J4E89_006188 [Alternaria sp. Ai002NY15]KAI4647837.1 hypothetical protein J4E93_004248 [Alternaria ventricosa]KAI4661650.1 hypothetical protein J4E78_004439 [Alternaria triti
MGSDLKDTAAPAKVKHQKAKRDECMLFSTSNDPQKECFTLVDDYKKCMAGYGFKI